MYERVCPRRCTYECTFQGAMFRAGCSIWDVSIVNENCRSVLAGTHGWMVQFGNFLQKERIIGKVFAEPFQVFSGCRRIVMPQIIKSKQYPGERHKEAAM